MTIIQWLVFRGVGHAQVGSCSPPLVGGVGGGGAPPPNLPHQGGGVGVRELPVVACGRTSWPGLVKYQPGPPRRICEECAAAVGIGHSAAAREAVVSRRESEPKKPSQGSLF